MVQTVEKHIFDVDMLRQLKKPSNYIKIVRHFYYFGVINAFIGIFYLFSTSKCKNQGQQLMFDPSFRPI